MKNKNSNKSRFYIGAMVVSTAVVATQVPVSAQTTFTDFGPGFSGFNEVSSLVNGGIITGYADGSFRPYEDVRRDHVALIISRALNLKTPANPQSILSIYEDIEVNDMYSGEVAAVTKSDIFIGDSGFFHPYKSISREQMASVLVRAFGFKETNSHINIVDIDLVGNSHRENVKILAQHGIVIGKTNDLGEKYFDPNSAITRAQFGMVMDRAVRVAKGEVLTTAPQVSNITISGTETVGETLTVNYNYDDLEGDKEGDSIIKWYRSDSSDGKNRQLIKDADETAYTLANEDEGKYLIAEVTPVAQSGNPSKGAPGESKSTGGIKAKEGFAPEVSNLALIGSENAGEKIMVTYDFKDADGDREGQSEYQWYRSDNAAGENEEKIEGATNTEYQLTKEDGGKHIRFEIIPVSETGTPTHGEGVSVKSTSMIGEADGHAPKAQNVSLKGQQLVGETLTGSYDYYDEDGDEEKDSVIKWYRSVDGGEKEVIDGAKDSEYTLTSEDEDKFIYFEVTPYAATGKQKEGVSQSAVTSGTIQAADGHAPEAQEVSLSGSEIVGKTLKGSYKYYDKDGDEEKGTTIQWYRADENGNKEKIDDANDSEYVLSTEDEGKLIYFEVTPNASTGKQKEGVSQSAVTSGTIQAADGHAPEAQDVDINYEGKLSVGKTLKGSYKFYDADKDEEKGTTFQWYRGDGNENKEIIKDENDIEYTLTIEDEGKFIYFEVIPRAATGKPKEGISKRKSTGEVQAAEGAAPIAKNVQIGGTETVGQKLSVIYDFEDADGDKEGESKYQWYRADNADGTNEKKITDATETNYQLTHKDEGKYIRVEVTPVSKTGGPAIGQKVSAQSTGKITAKQGSAPEANAINITGTLMVEGELTGNYTYSHPEDIEEGDSSYQWYRNKEKIDGATDRTYKLTMDDLDAIISFEITPVAKKGDPKKGDTQTVDSNSKIKNNVDVSITALLNEINEANALLGNAETGLRDGDYPQEAKDTLERAIAEADQVVSKENVTQAMLDAAESTLRRAVQLFKQQEVKVDRNYLKLIITHAEKVDKNNKTDDSLEGFDDALAGAKVVFGAEKPTQKEVDDAFEKLDVAINGLIDIDDLNKEPFRYAIFQAKDISRAATVGEFHGDYPQDALDTLMAAIDEAEASINDSSNKTQDSIDDAKETLDVAIQNFRDSKVVVDKSDLTNMIDQALALVRTDYTSESWNNLVEARNGAIEKEETERVTQMEVDEAADSLRQAIRHMEEKDSTEKTLLINEIDSATDLADNAKKDGTEGSYTEESIEALQDATKEAQVSYDDEYAKQSNIDQALLDLKKAVNRFESSAVVLNRLNLKTAIAYSEQLKENDYTGVSWNNLQNALSDANDEVDTNNETATQESLNDAHLQLITAISALIPDNTSAVNTQGLLYQSFVAQQKVDNAEPGDKNGEYSQSAIDDLQSAIDQASDVMNEVNNDHATQSDVNAATIVLIQAITTFDDTQIKVDKLALFNAIVIAKTLKENDYTAASWTELQDTITSAETINTKTDVSQEEVNTALSDLSDAIGNLEDSTALQTFNLQLKIANVQTIHANAIEGDAEGQYKNGSKSDLQAAITQAQDVVDNAINQADIEGAITALQSALDSFKAKQVTVNKQALNNVLILVSTLDSTKYTNSSWSDLDTQRVLAQGVLQNSTANQAQVDEALDVLNSAIGNLVLEDDNIVNNIKLHLKINQAETILSLSNEADYEAGAKANLQNKVNEAKNTLEDLNVTQHEIGDAVSMLGGAIDLFLTQKINDETSGDDGETGVTDKPTTQSEFDTLLAGGNGDIDIDLSDFEEQSLNVNDTRAMNLNLNGTKTFSGDVTIDAPNATVTIASGIIVEGMLTVIDVNSNSLINQGTLGDVEIKDNNESRFVNNGTVNGILTISGKGNIELEGNLEDVKVTNAEAKVTVKSGSDVTFTEIISGADVTDADGNTINPDNEQGEQAAVDGEADGISDAMTVGQDTDILELPTVAEGYSVAVTSSDNTEVITSEGVVIPPVSTSTVNVTFTVTKDGTEFTADKEVAVTVEQSSAGLEAELAAAAFTIDLNTDSGQFRAGATFVSVVINGEKVATTKDRFEFDGDESVTEIVDGLIANSPENDGSNEYDWGYKVEAVDGEPTKVKIIPLSLEKVLDQTADEFHLVGLGGHDADEPNSNSQPLNQALTFENATD